MTNKRCPATILAHNLIAKEKGLPVIVAGLPESKDALSQKGIVEFIHLKSSVLDTLVELQKRILGSSVGSYEKKA